MTRGLVLAAAALLGSGAHAQVDACKPFRSKTEMVCSKRLGHCVQLQIDGQTTTPATDAAFVKSMEPLRLRSPVCWKLDRPVSRRFRLQAQAGGLWPDWLGRQESISVAVYAIEDYDPVNDSRLMPLLGTGTEADGYRDGTWQLRSEQELAAGRYVVKVTANGSGHWDRQVVLLTVDPDLDPPPPDPGRR